MPRFLQSMVAVVHLFDIYLIAGRGGYLLEPMRSQGRRINGWNVATPGCILRSPYGTSCIRPLTWSSQAVKYLVYALGYKIRVPCIFFLLFFKNSLHMCGPRGVRMSGLNQADPWGWQVNLPPRLSMYMSRCCRDS